MIEAQKKCLIVGLGNPGAKYATTWHNLGFLVVDALAQKYQASFSLQKKLYAQNATARVDHHLLYLAKPTTFMNESGKAIRAMLDFYKISILNLLIIVDDIDLSFGQLRMKEKGSAGGHNGLKSIIHHLGTNQFCRLRVGISGMQHDHEPLESYVLRSWPEEKEKEIKEMVNQSALAVEKWVMQGPLPAMNLINKKNLEKYKE